MGPVMKLYTSRLAPNPRRVRWLMAEKGIDDIEIEDVDLMTGAHRAPDYVALAGIANTPALTLDSGVTITESVAICRYLESLYPEPNLFGRGAEEIAVIEMWTRRAEMKGATPLMMAVRHLHPALAALETQSAEVGANFVEVATAALPLFEARLGQCDWIGGDRITIADGILYSGLEFARMVRFKIPDTMPLLTGWLAAMRERPSGKAGG